MRFKEKDIGLRLGLLCPCLAGSHKYRAVRKNGVMGLLGKLGGMIKKLRKIFLKVGFCFVMQKVLVGNLANN